MIKFIKNFILKIKCRKIYKQLPTEVKLQLYLEMFQPENKNASYNDILKKEFELKDKQNV